MKVVLIGAVCFAAGFFACKFVLEAKLEEKAAQDAQEAREFYLKRTAEKLDERQGLVDEACEVIIESEKEQEAEVYKSALKMYQHGLTPVPEPKIPTVVRERPKASNPTPVPEDTSIPYIITDEDFFEGYPDHTALTFTWYEDDDTLVAANDTPVEGKVRVGLIGEDKDLLIFDGNKSGDTCVVYIRSHAATSDCEIVYNAGKYSEEVLGL